MVAMHDFCLTLPYGMILAVGGFIGFLSKQSLPSLLAGCGCGALLMRLGNRSLNAFKEQGQAYDGSEFTKQSLVITLVVGAAMGKRFYSDGAAFMPAGLVFYMSAGMAAFYLLKLSEKPAAGKKSE